MWKDKYLLLLVCLTGSTITYVLAFLIPSIEKTILLRSWEKCRLSQIVASRQHQKLKAVKAARQEVELADKLADHIERRALSHLDLAETLYEKKQFTDALAQFEAAEQLNLQVIAATKVREDLTAELLRIRLGKAMCLAALKRASEAEESLAKSLEESRVAFESTGKFSPIVNQYMANTLVELSRLAQELGNNKLAEECLYQLLSSFRLASSFPGRLPELKASYVRILRAQGLNKEACEIQESRWKEFMDQGQALESNFDYVLAAQKFELALSEAKRLPPNPIHSFLALAHLSACYFRCGDLKEATDFFNQAINSEGMYLYDCGGMMSRASKCLVETAFNIERHKDVRKIVETQISNRAAKQYKLVSLDFESYVRLAVIERTSGENPEESLRNSWEAFQHISSKHLERVPDPDSMLLFSIFLALRNENAKADRVLQKLGKCLNEAEKPAAKWTQWPHERRFSLTYLYAIYDYHRHGWSKYYWKTIAKVRGTSEFQALSASQRLNLSRLLEIQARCFKCLGEPDAASALLKESSIIQEQAEKDK